VIYAEPRPLAPVRTAYAERSSLGGGFIEFCLAMDGIKMSAISSSHPTSRGVRCFRSLNRSTCCASRKMTARPAACVQSDIREATR